MSAPTTIEAAVTGIVDRLKAVGPVLDVQAFPDDPKEYRLKHPIGGALVAYRGANYEPLDMDGGADTKRTMQFDVHVITSTLKGPKGALSNLEAVRIALAGYQLPGFSRFVPSAERFLGREETKWMHAITFSASTLAVVDDPDDAGAAVARLTVVSPFATSEIPDA